MDKSQGPSLHKAWRPNVTLVSSDSPLELLSGQVDDDAVARSLTALTFCPFKSLKLLLMSPGDENILPRQEAFRSAAVFFSEVALGLTGFLDAGTLRAELFLGDVHDLGNTVPVESLDRILISNVPDYTTLLPSMIKLTPLLKLTPGAALKHSVLKFNANFQDLPEYAHSMGLYVPDMASLPLYLGVNHEYGGIWAHLIEWSRAAPVMGGEGEKGGEGEGGGGRAEMDGEGDNKEKIVNAFAGKDLAQLQQHLPPAPDVQAWLATVFLSIAMPLARDCVGNKTEIRPLSLHAFFELCHYLASHMDFPPHNLAWVIEHAMRGELKTAAVPPDATPWSPHYTWRQHHFLTRSVPTGAFALETRTLAGLWQRKLDFRLCAPLGQKIPQPEDVTQLRLVLPEVDEARFKLTGYPLAKVVGACLVSPDFMVEHAEALDPANYHLPERHSGVSPSSSLSSSPPSKDGGGGEEEVEQGLRPLLLKYDTQRTGQVHLFSCVRWDSQTSLVTMLLPKADLRELVDKEYHLILLRTDSWHPLTRPFPLSDEQVAGEEAMEVCHQSSAVASPAPSPSLEQQEGGAAAAHAHVGAGSSVPGASAASSSRFFSLGGVAAGEDAYHMHKTKTL